LVGAKEERTYFIGVKETFDKFMTLIGFTSTLLNREKAESFSFEDDDSGKKMVLLVLMWRRKFSYYYMNMGAFPHEDEVILYDGSRFEVLSVDEDSNKEMTVITMKYAFYDAL
jgi:hypothetical protein